MDIKSLFEKVESFKIIKTKPFRIYFMKSYLQKIRFNYNSFLQFIGNEKYVEILKLFDSYKKQDSKFFILMLLIFDYIHYLTGNYTKYDTLDLEIGNMDDLVYLLIDNNPSLMVELLGDEKFLNICLELYNISIIHYFL